MNVKRELIVGKAESVHDGPLPDVHILVAGRLPEFTIGSQEVNLARWDEYCETGAVELEDALYSSLPGGIYDRLLGRMLARKSTHFRVAHKSFEQEMIMS